MPLSFAAHPVPLREEPTGTVRVGGTRVTLDTVLTRYNLGDSPEQIVDGFPTLRLADVHATISYYLNYREEVDAYLVKRKKEAAKLRQEIESSSDPAEFQQRMLARWAERQTPKH